MEARKDGIDNGTVSHLIVNAFQHEGGAFALPPTLAEMLVNTYGHILDPVPVWVFFIVMVLIALAPIEVGQRCGARRRRAPDHEQTGPVGSVVAATLALLGFLVALTVSTANSRFDSRKGAMIDDVNAIETAFRTASLLPEPHNRETRKLLREYVAIRLEMPNTFERPEQLQKVDARIRSLQRSLWSQAEFLSKQDQYSRTYLLFVNSLNEMIQIHNKRVILGAHYRIPMLLWLVLIIVTVNCMFGVGFLFGLAGNRSPVADVMLVATFALVITLIFDLDQPAKGFIDVNQQPMYDLHERLRTED